MENQIPNLFKLYRKDFTMKNSIQAIVVPLIFFGGLYFIDPSIIDFAPFLPYIAAGISLLGLIVFVLRYQFVTSTLRDGVTIKGKVEGFDHHQTVEKNDYGHVKSRRTSYYVNISYTVDGETYKKQIRMPNSGFVYNIHDKQEVELMYKESSPQKVLIKNVYFSKF